MQVIATLCKQEPILIEICSIIVENIQREEFRTGAKDDRRLLPYFGILVVCLLGEEATAPEEIRQFTKFLSEKEIREFPG